MSGSTVYPGRSFRTFILVTAMGLAVGVLTVVAQNAVPATWKTWANSGAVWLVPAFFAGSLMRTTRSAAVAGIVTLLGAIVGYYASIPFNVDGAVVDTRSIAVWVGVALAGGPALGIAGHWWREDRGRGRIVALGLLGGVFLGEGLDRLLRNARIGTAGWAMMTVGIVIPWSSVAPRGSVCGASPRSPPWSLRPFSSIRSSTRRLCGHDHRGAPPQAEPSRYIREPRPCKPFVPGRLGTRLSERAPSRR